MNKSTKSILKYPVDFLVHFIVLSFFLLVMPVMYWGQVYSGLEIGFIMTTILILSAVLLFVEIVVEHLME